MVVSTGSMTIAEFRALAEFRYQIRLFLNGSEEAARNAGLEPQQYLLMLALRGLPVGREPSIRELAERMQLRHHSVVELVDRLEKRQILRRERSRTDRRQVLVHLTPRGERILTRLAKQRISELRTAAPGAGPLADHRDPIDARKPAQPAIPAGRRLAAATGTTGFRLCIETKGIASVKPFARRSASDESAQGPVGFRLGFISLLASIVGVISGFVAFSSST